ncbi:sulfatase [Mumia zhuanghuii]|uniref:Sulfatase n=2 Tax=Mumia TaxID=1546255 RepID=A0ABW1QQM0_9ACTN|nr:MULTISPECIES: sulfatase [Mumia]KAA1424518.1 sulfatase [Mumia zhuanghuii]
MPSSKLLGAIAAPAVLSMVCTGLVFAAQPGQAAPPAAPAGSKHDHRKAPRPNIVYVMADDLGWSDLGTGRTNGGHGNDFNETPVLDSLAEEGAVFDNAYASPQCAPTRSALLTGQYATRPTNNIYAVGGINNTTTSPLVGVPQGRADGAVNAVPTEFPTFAETLQDAGYSTGYAGKFHVAATAQEIVESHGFDESWGGGPWSHATVYHASGGTFNDTVAPELDKYAADYSQEYVDENIAPYSQGVSEEQVDALVGTPKHVTDAITDAAIDYIDRSKDKDKPFFTYLSQYAPHFPVANFQARTDLLAKYQAKTPAADPASPAYAALVEGIDQSVARVIDYLEETPDPRNHGRPLADNTLVIFTSDNGGETNQGSFNEPLRGRKSELYDGGVRIPWIVWSGNRDLVKPRSTNHTVINGVDLYPTLASYAGAKLPKRVPLDGIDLRPAFSKGRELDRDLFHHLPGYIRGGAEPGSTIRSGRWKLYYFYTDQRFELYDLQSDIGETDDVSERHPRLVRSLGTKLGAWLDRTSAPLATLRAGQPPVVIDGFTGLTYAEGRLARHRGDTITIEPGEEVPFVLPTR